jgi:hypothetical protein
MKNKTLTIIRKCLLWIVFFTMKMNSLIAQKELSSEDLLAYSHRFTINENLTFDESSKVLWKNIIGDNRIVGIAEKHHSRELGKFTTALLPVLKEIGFKTFALELGPNSAEILNELSSDSIALSESIRLLNRRYGKKPASKTPLVFVNRKSDIHFLNRAQTLGFEFWGLDQEYVYSYEMLFDRMDSFSRENYDQKLFEKAKKVIHKNLFKSKVDGEPVYCFYQSNEILTAYLNRVNKNPQALKIADDIRISWEIYCKEASGIFASQMRADYMKSNFDSYFEKKKPQKILIKMGNIHLTHNESPFGVNDLGKHITMKAEAESFGYINIRFFNPYLNGKYQGDKSSLKMLKSIGLKDQWTVVDLLPIRELILKNEIKTNDPYLYEMMNYDLLLLAPDDKYDKKNNY